jgi:hypothetical protein
MSTACSLCRAIISDAEAHAASQAQGDLFDPSPATCLVCAERIAFAGVSYAAAKLRALVSSLANRPDADAPRWKLLALAIQRVDELELKKDRYLAAGALHQEARHG